MANVTIMKLADIRGESRRHGHYEWVDLLTCSVGVNTPINPRDLNFIITKTLDIVSGRLQSMCCEGRAVPQITLHIVDEQTMRVVKKIAFTDVMVSCYNTGSSADGLPPVETIGFNARNVRLL